MRELTDETLMAFADGHLDDGQRSLVLQALDRDPGSRERLAAFVATVPDAEIWRVFDQPMREAVPRHLVELVMAGSSSSFGGRQAIAPGMVRTAIDTARNILWPDHGGWSPGLGYAAALAVGLSLGWVLHPGQGPTVASELAEAGGPDGMRAELGLRASLESTASGAVHGVALRSNSSWRVTPTNSFRSRDGAFCRQYEMSQPQSDAAFAGVACRTRAGQWVVQTHAASTKTVAGADNNVRPADGKKMKSPVEVAVSAMIDGDPLGPDEERQLMTKGWPTGK